MKNIKDYSDNEMSTNTLGNIIDNVDVDLAVIDEFNQDDVKMVVVKTIEPTETLEDYLKHSSDWFKSITNDRQKAKEAHISIIVTLRDAYLQTFEQIAKLLNDYYGITKSRQSIHSLYERLKKRESDAVDDKTELNILIMRLFGMSIAKIHNTFPELTEYHIGEIINANKDKTEELKANIIERLARKIASITVSVGDYGLNSKTIRLTLHEAVYEIRRTIKIKTPNIEINEKILNEFIGLAVDKVIEDRIKVMASIIYGSHTPSLKSAKSFMLKHGIDSSLVTAKCLNDIWE